MSEGFLEHCLNLAVVGGDLLQLDCTSVCKDHVCIKTVCVCVCVCVCVG